MPRYGRLKPDRQQWQGQQQQATAAGNSSRNVCCNVCALLSFLQCHLGQPRHYSVWHGCEEVSLDNSIHKQDEDQRRKWQEPEDSMDAKMKIPRIDGLILSHGSTIFAILLKLGACGPLAVLVALQTLVQVLRSLHVLGQRPNLPWQCLCYHATDAHSSP